MRLPVELLIRVGIVFVKLVQQRNGTGDLVAVVRVKFRVAFTIIGVQFGNRGFSGVRRFVTRRQHFDGF
jgi:hypothetical protein